ncbi:MAG: hypothetical protein JXR25_11850 [Pontiellaceae bacterium]|nr:hypothetical protein [Pontiellaceae bacterium]
MALTSYAELIGRTVAGMAAFPAPALVLDRMRDVARDFCRETQALVVDFTLDRVAGERRYALIPEFDASVLKVVGVFRRTSADIAAERDGSPVSFNDFDLQDGGYSSGGLSVQASIAGFIESGVFRENGETLNDLSVYAGPNSTDYLFCGFSAGGTGIVYYIASAADYLSAQSGHVPVNAYYLPPPFSDVIGEYSAQGSFDGTATVSRTTAVNSSVKNLVFKPGCAPASSLDSGILVRAVMMPDAFAEELPASFLNDYQDALIAGTRSRLLSIPRRPWSDPVQAERENSNYQRMITDAKWNAVTGGKSMTFRATGRGGAFFV